MDATLINWDSLDALVLDFALLDRLISPNPSSNSPPSSPSSSSSSSAYRSRLLIRQIRRAIELGDLDCAIDLLRCHVPAILDDHRILFRLQKQKFVELLRRGTAKDREAAIECLRVALAPCALDAYPEAYEEFKHVLLALLFDKEDQNSPVAREWSERRRFELAGLLSSMLRAHLHAYDPIFSLTLRYLICIHKVFCTRQGVPSPISDLTERLLYEDRDPPAIPQEILYEAPPFDEVDIQALAHAVELTRQGAVDSLKFAKGDLFQAFQNELCRMKLDIPMLDNLVHEYCVYRGIVDGIVKSPPVSDLVHSSSTECSSPILDCASSRISDGDISVNDTDIQGVSDALVDTSSMPKNDGEVRFACEIGNSIEDCSTSDDKHHETYCRRLRRNRNYASGQGRRKRWRGRVEDLEPNSFATMTHDSTDSAVIEELENKNLRTICKNIEDNKFELILEIRELAYKGMAAKVFEEINLVDPDFFQQNPTLLFQLKQVEFLALVNSGDHAKALEVASTYLGPLAASDQSLLKPLKETLLALLEPGQDVTPKGTSLPLLATSLQVAMGRKLGIEEPQLMKIVRATLHTHNEWFKLQMCKDRFEHFLKIDQLKEIDSSMRSTATKMSLDECSNVSSQITTNSNFKTPEDGSSPQASCGEIICDENAILKVMEFLALPRADAIHLLVQYNGNAEVVIQQIFS